MQQRTPQPYAAAMQRSVGALGVIWLESYLAILVARVIPTDFRTNREGHAVRIYVTGRDIVQFSGQAQKKENSVYPIRPRCINGF